MIEPPTRADAARAIQDGQAWRIELPAAMELLNANHRLHRQEAAKRTAAIREAAGWIARAAKIPRLGRSRVSGEYLPPDRRRRDAGNLHPSLKAAVDGLVDAGLWRDDTAEYVVDGGIRLGPPTAGGLFVIHITPVEDEES